MQLRTLYMRNSTKEVEMRGLIALRLAFVNLEKTTLQVKLS